MQDLFALAIVVFILAAACGSPPRGRGGRTFWRNTSKGLRNGTRTRRGGRDG